MKGVIVGQHRLLRKKMQRRIYNLLNTLRYVEISLSFAELQCNSISIQALQNRVAYEDHSANI